MIPQRFGSPALRLVSNEEVDAAQAAAVPSPQAVEQAAQVFGGSTRAMDMLASHCRREFEAAYQAKQNGTETKMLQDMRQIIGEYDPEDLAQIRKQGGSEVFLQLTAEKYYGAIAWVSDLLTQDRPFGCKPTDVSTIPEFVMQQIVAQSEYDLQASGMLYQPQDLHRRVRYYEEEVKRRVRDAAKVQAEHAADVVDDVFTEGGWYDAVLEAAEDGVALGTGIVVGPHVRMGMVMQWGPEPGQDMGVKKAKRSYYSLSPFDAYPSPAMKQNINELPFTERQRWSRADFMATIGIKGFQEVKVRELLDLYGRGGRRDWMSGDTTRAGIEGRRNEYTGNTDALIDVARHWTSVPAKMLVEWGMQEAAGMDPDQEVNIEAYFVDSTVFGARVVDDALGQRPYAVWRFRPIRGAFWGESLPRSMRSVQKFCNAAGRALAENMGLASGPMLEVETDRLAAGEKITQLHPWRIWQTVRNPNGSPSAAVRQINVDMHAGPLLEVLQFFMPMADRLTGIPSYSYGVPETRGAAGTASGLAQLRSDAARGLKRVMNGIDRAIKQTVELTIRHLRKYPDPEYGPIEGDVNVQGEGTTALTTRETEQARMVEILAQTANPIDQQVFGPKYPALRTELWRGALKHFNGIDTEEALPTRDEVRAMTLQAQMMAGMQPPGGGGQQQPGARELDASGAPAGGVDANLV